MATATDLPQTITHTDSRSAAMCPRCGTGSAGGYGPREIRSDGCSDCDGMCDEWAAEQLERAASGFPGGPAICPRCGTPPSDPAGYGQVVRRADGCTCCDPWSDQAAAASRQQAWLERVSLTDQEGRRRPLCRIHWGQPYGQDVSVYVLAPQKLEVVDFERDALWLDITSMRGDDHLAWRLDSSDLSAYGEHAWEGWGRFHVRHLIHRASQDYYRQAQEELQGLPQAVRLASELGGWRLESEAIDSAALATESLETAVLLEDASRRGVFRVDLEGVST